MSLIAWLLWTLFGGTLGGPVETPQVAFPHPSFHHLPVFQHAAQPLVPRELFRPVPYKAPLPAGLTSLLLPDQPQQQNIPSTGSRGVEVWCGTDQISVRLDRLQLRAWTVPSRFRLGSCAVGRVSPRYLYFHYKLTACGGESKVVDGQLVYTFLLQYTPPPQGYVIRVPPLNLPIHCQYNRFHYSYKVGFRPQVQQTTIMRGIRSKLSYSLTVCNAQGEPVPPGHWFFLGEPVHFVAQARMLLSGERLYVDSCYATTSQDPNSASKMDIITNYGCMTDSSREGSSSRFLLAGGSVLKFSVDAFLFRAVSQVLYLHCSMSVGLATSHISKSCNYNRATGRWEELVTTASVCSCCESMCSDTHDSVKNTVSSPGWFIGQSGKGIPQKVSAFQAEEAREQVDQDEKTEERIDERHKQIQALAQETKISFKEKDAFPEKKHWRSSAAVSQQGERQKEEEVMKKAGSISMASKGTTISDQTTPEGAREEVPSTKDVSLRGLSVDISAINASRDDSAAPTSFGIDDNTGNHSSIGNISTAVNISPDVIPVIKPCPENDRMNCSGSIHIAGDGDMYTATRAESLTPNNVSTTSGTSRSGSQWDSGHNASQLGSGFETSNGTNLTTRHFEIDPLTSLDIRKSRIIKEASEELDTVLSSEQVQSSNKFLDNQNKTRGEADSVDYATSEGPHGQDDHLHSLQIRGLESDHSADPADWLLGESDFDSGVKEDEAYQSQFTGDVKTWNKEEFSNPITRPHSDSSGHVGSEKLLQVSPSHSAVVIVTSPPQDPESRRLSERLWAELLPGWGWQSLGFVVEQPTEELRRSSMDDFY